MTTSVQSMLQTKRPDQKVSPSIIRDEDASPFSLDQELTEFGRWSSEPIWVPPKGCSKELAKSMLEDYGLFSSKESCWSGLIDEHRSKFTQVRELDMSQASIRLPKGKLYVTVTEQSRFNEITDPIPNCVRTRLDEFLAGPGKKRGVKVYYLKPLCVEVGDDLIFTKHDELMAAIKKIQDEVFSEYRRLYLTHRPGRMALQALDMGLAVPRSFFKYVIERKKRTIEAYHAKLEFNRRKAAMRAANMRKKYRTDDCSFDEILSLTTTPDRVDVIEQFAIENELSNAKKMQLLKLSAATLPWFVSFSLIVTYIASTTVTALPPMMVCDPAFVAEMPDSKGVLLKIGHFDEVAGVTHVEI